MRSTALALFLIIALSDLASAQSAGGSKSVSRGTRSYYGTDFGNRYQYFGLGYGYGPGSFGPGGWSAFGGRGGYGGYGGYGRSRNSRYGGYSLYEQQLENLHEQQMMWSMNFAPMPQTAPGVTVNPYWNPYQSRLHDDIFHRAEPAPAAKAYNNPFLGEHR